MDKETLDHRVSVEVDGVDPEGVGHRLPKGTVVDRRMDHRYLHHQDRTS